MRFGYFAIAAFVILGCVSHPALKKRKVASSQSCELVNHPHRNSLPQLVAETVRQINSGASQKLIPLISCEGLVGPPRAEAEGIAKREIAASVLPQKLRGMHWQNVGMLSGDVYTLGSKSPSPFSELVFRRYEGAGWYFAGIGTLDEALRRRMMKP